MSSLLIKHPEGVTPPGLSACLQRAVNSCALAGVWARLRVDAIPAEVQLASILNELGELLLWQFAPDLPMASSDMILANPSMRTEDVRTEVCGFTFKELTLACAAKLKLPSPVIQLVSGKDTLRANIARLATDTVRHLQQDGAASPALPDDIRDAAALLNRSVSTVVQAIPGLTLQDQLALIERTKESA